MFFVNVCLAFVFFRGVVFFLGWLARFSDDKMTGNTDSIWHSLSLIRTQNFVYMDDHYFCRCHVKVTWCDRHGYNKVNGFINVVQPLAARCATRCKTVLQLDILWTDNLTQTISWDTIRFCLSLSLDHHRTVRLPIIRRGSRFFCIPDQMPILKYISVALRCFHHYNSMEITREKHQNN